MFCVLSPLRCEFSSLLRKRGEIGVQGGGSGDGNCDGEACKVTGMYVPNAAFGN